MSTQPVYESPAAQLAKAKEKGWFIRIDLLLYAGVELMDIVVAIEEKGVSTYDRFGRIVKVTTGGAEDHRSKEHILEGLASWRDHQAIASAYEKGDPFWHDTIFSNFGWKSDALPEFGAVEPVDKSRREMQRDVTLTALRKLGHDPMAVPLGGKAEAKRSCIASDPKLFTKDSFDHSWKEMCRKGLVKTINQKVSST